MPNVVIDRLVESDRVVLELEASRSVEVPRSWIPKGAQEGDVLRVEIQPGAAQSQTITFEIDSQATEERRAQASQMRDKLPRGPKGDIAL